MATVGFFLESTGLNDTIDQLGREIQSLVPYRIGKQKTIVMKIPPTQECEAITEL